MTFRLSRKTWVVFHICERTVEELLIYCSFAVISGWRKEGEKQRRLREPNDIRGEFQKFSKASPCRLVVIWKGLVSSDKLWGWYFFSTRNIKENTKTFSPSETICTLLDKVTRFLATKSFEICLKWKLYICELFILQKRRNDFC